MSSIAANTWVSTGNDYVIDGLWGRLGVQKKFGETYVSGATNGLEIRESDDKVFLYAGAVNGGIHLRVYDKQSDSWQQSWNWINKPGSGYEGSQSIGVLSLSPNRQYLAVGQGNPSNGGRLAAPSQGVKIGKINNDGTVDWLGVSISKYLSELEGKNIRSIEWVDNNTLVASSVDDISGVGELFTITFSDGEVTNVNKIDHETSQNLFVSKGAKHLIAAGYNIAGPNELVLKITEPNSSQFVKIEGDIYKKLSAEITANSKIARSAVHNQLTEDRKLIVYLGAFNTEGDDYISKIYQLIINTENFNIDSYKKYEVRPNEDGYGFDLGTRQGSNKSFYGNFSLAVDPRDPTGNSVFVGGNQFGSATFVSPTYDGGLVQLDFSGDSGVIADRLYGPKVNTVNLENDVRSNTVKETPSYPGQPHADSRTISFYHSASGHNLVQTDDGGIWKLELDKTNKNNDNQSWWESLTTKGLNTLEMNVAAWNAANNSIAAAYQDNAASLGYFGDDHATNFWVADGTMALFDDGDNNGEYIGYLGFYDYIKNGSLAGLTYNSDGYITSRKKTRLYLQSPEGDELISWNDNKQEWQAQQIYLYSNKKDSIFSVPVQSNAYQKGIAFYGFGNIYDTVDTQGSIPGTTLSLRPLLREYTKNGYLYGESLDYQGDDGTFLNQSLYSGGVKVIHSENGEIINVARQIFGRQANNSPDGYSLNSLDFLNLTQEELNNNGTIVDIAHSKTSGGDVVYWIQGGMSTNFGVFKNYYGVPSGQTLYIRDTSGNVKDYDLSNLQYRNDKMGYQTLVYVPAKEDRKARLVLGGLNGPYYVELDEEGFPLNEIPQFERMSWSDLPADEVPGSYIRSMEYDPVDDLLFAATQGQGAFIYDFDGNLGQRDPGTKLLNISNIEIPLQYEPDKDKRGNEQNSTITIQLNNKLQNQQSPTSVEIVLEDAAKWREAMDFVSLYDFNNLDRPAMNFLDVLTKDGLHYNGAREENGDIIIPISFPKNVSIFNLIVNQKEVTDPNEKIDLLYSARTADGVEETATLSLIPSYPATKAVEIMKTFSENIFISDHIQISQYHINQSAGENETFIFNDALYSDIKQDDLGGNYNLPIKINPGIYSTRSVNISFNLGEERELIDISAAANGGGTIASNAPINSLDNITGVYFNSASGDDIIEGSKFDDFIRGGAGDDQINANAGDDVIRGGAGSDEMILGAGADIVYYTIDQIDGSIDVITDFSSEDIIKIGKGVEVLSLTDDELTLSATLDGVISTVTVLMSGIEISQIFSV